MYSLQKKPYGCRITLGGIVNQEEMTHFYEDSVRYLKLTEPEFGVLVDMRELQPLSHPAQSEIDKVQRAFRKAGMVRSVVILSSPIIKRQFEEIAKESGIYQWERYIDASTSPEWEQIGLEWIEKAIDPEIRQKDQSPA